MCLLHSKMNETAVKEMRQGTPASRSVSSSYFTLAFSPHAKWK